MIPRLRNQLRSLPNALRVLPIALRQASHLLRDRNLWKGEFLLFASVTAGVLFHLADAPRDAVITPFPFIPTFPIHPEPWLHMALWRVRLLILYMVIYFAVPRMWIFTTVLFFLELIDLIDYLLRYGQDYLPGIDANTFKVIACLIIGLVSLIKSIRKHEIS